MQASPRLNQPADMAGSWDLEGPQGGCSLTLATEEAALAPGSLAAPMHALTIDGNCLSGTGASGWRPIPLGLEFDDTEGYSVLVFEQVGDTIYRTPDGTWTLTRR